MAGVPLWLIIATVASYLAFFVAFGEEIFTAPDGSCSGILDCATGVFSILGDFFAFITLGGFTSPLPLIIQAPLVLFFGASWGFAIADVILP